MTNSTKPDNIVWLLSNILEGIRNKARKQLDLYQTDVQAAERNAELVILECHRDADRALQVLIKGGDNGGI